MTMEAPPAMRALKAVYDETRESRAAAERLAPLLSLLDPAEQGEGSPLGDVTNLLETIARTQGATLKAIEALAEQVAELVRRLP